MVVIKHKIIPVSIGNSIEYNTHLILPVSFFIVRQVVEQGKWNRVIISILTAVKIVQLFWSNKSFKNCRLEKSVIFPRDI